MYIPKPLQLVNELIGFYPTVMLTMASLLGFVMLAFRLRMEKKPLPQLLRLPNETSEQHKIRCRNIIFNGILEFPQYPSYQKHLFPDIKKLSPDTIKKIQKSVPYREMISFLERHIESGKSVPGFVSLSCGVDSSVAAHILAIYLHYPPKSGCKITELRTAHVNYDNRGETDIEQRFVELYCEFLTAKLKTFKMPFKRAETEREEYETRATKHRYGFYKEEIESMNGPPAVILAHHKDDVLENLISNSMKGRNIYDLTVMHETGTPNGVPVWRPFINITKSEIYKYSHDFNVPYFLDTTPDWSVRGKTRRRLIPLLDNIYGTGFRQGLWSIGEQSDDWAPIIKSKIIEPYIATRVTKHKLGFGISLEELIPKSMLQMVLLELFHEYDTGMISSKSLRELYKKFNELHKNFKSETMTTSTTNNTVISLSKSLRALCFNGSLWFLVHDMLQIKPDTESLIPNGGAGGNRRKNEENPFKNLKWNYKVASSSHDMTLYYTDAYDIFTELMNGNIQYKVVTDLPANRLTSTIFSEAESTTEDLKDTTDEIDETSLSDMLILDTSAKSKNTKQILKAANNTFITNDTITMTETLDRQAMFPSLFLQAFNFKLMPVGIMREVCDPDITAKSYYYITAQISDLM